MARILERRRRGWVRPDGLWMGLILGLAFGASLAQEPALRSGPVVFRHGPEDRRSALRFLEATPRALAVVTSLTGLALPEPTVVEIVRDGATLVRRCREETGTELPGFVAGISLRGRRHVIVRTDLPGPRWEQVDGLLAHELCHVALDALRARPGSGAIPRWFDEGVAQLAEGRLFVEVGPQLGPRAWLGTLLDFDQLERSFPETEGASGLAYAQSESFVRHLQRAARDRGGLPAILAELGSGADLDAAVRSATSFGLEVHGKLWRQDLRRDRSWILGSVRDLGFALFLLVAVFAGVRYRLRRRLEWERRWAAEGSGAATEDREEDDSTPGDQASTSSSR